jgi:hypothetical protein
MYYFLHNKKVKATALLEEPGSGSRFGFKAGFLDPYPDLHKMNAGLKQ